MRGVRLGRMLAGTAIVLLVATASAGNARAETPADALKAIEAGQAEFAQIPARTFFGVLFQNTMEGYFADPMYGGNRNSAVWKMIGFHLSV